MFSCGYCKIFEKRFYRTPLVPANLTADIDKGANHAVSKWRMISFVYLPKYLFFSSITFFPALPFFKHYLCSFRKGVFDNFAKFTGKHLCQSLFFNKTAGLRLALLLKKDSGTGCFLWILGNFWEHFFYRIPPGDCFYVFKNLPIFYRLTLFVLQFKVACRVQIE